MVVITGASSGNGRAAAHTFAQRGETVVLVARREDALAEAAAECMAFGGTALAIPADVTDSAAVGAVAERTLAGFGRIDVWVNCAAVLHFGRVEDTPSGVIEQVLRTNIVGYFNGAQVAIRQFRKQRSGVLINVSSVLAITAQPYASAYVASKAAIRGMSDSLRQEVSDVPGISICTVLPYAIDTPIYQRAANYTGRQMRPVVPRYSAETVAETIVGLVDRPRREAFAGKIGALAALQKALAPPLSDFVVRQAAHLLEFGDEAAAATAGNVFEPVHDRWRVSGGWRQSAGRVQPRPMVLLGLALVGGAAAFVALRSRSAGSKPSEDDTRKRGTVTRQ